MNGFFAIDIARKALMTAQQGLDVTAHNIANANTEGYSRQRVIQGTTTPFPAPSFNRPGITAMFGTGVEVKNVERVRESYFDGQLRRENQSLGTWEVSDNTLKQLETVFNEPSESSLQNIMGEFYNAWQQLSKNPESISVRRTVLQTGSSVVTAFNQLDDKLDRLRDNLNEQIEVKVDTINNYALRISSLNRDILRAKTFNMSPNDLMDQRDQLIDELSKIVDIQVFNLDTGVSVIAINGGLLVNEYGTDLLQTVPNGLNNGYYDIEWESNEQALTMYGGELKSLVDSRDTTVPGYKTELDALADTLISQVNDIHAAGIGLDGTTGWAFFSGSAASDIALSDDVDDPNHIGASLSGAVGDSSNALQIAQLKNALVMSGDTVTMDDYYRGIITNLGIDSQSAGRMVSNSKLYYDLISNQKQSVSGVSLDEEATNMIKYQRAYQAAARVITVTDEMLQDLINIGR